MTRPGHLTDEEREQALVATLAELCEPEIVAALLEDIAGRVFCGLWLVYRSDGTLRAYAGDLTPVKDGVREVLRTTPRLVNPEPADDVLGRVKSSVAQELSRRRDQRVARLRTLKASELLPEFLKMVRRGFHWNATVFLDYLTPQQRSDLKELAHARVSDRPTVLLRMDVEPLDDECRWVLWYLYRSELLRPDAREKLGGIPRYVFAVRRGAVGFNKDGEPFFPLLPIYAKAYIELGKELARNGKLKDPSSVRRIARSFNVSHHYASKALRADVPVFVESDGKGGVRWNFTEENVARSVEQMASRKRGPKRRSEDN